MLVGSVLIAWILYEFTIISDLMLLQPILITVGALMVATPLLPSMRGHFKTNDMRSQIGKERRARATRAIGLLAIVSSALYFVSDVIEVAAGGFSTGQLWLTLIAEATAPIFVIGLWLAQRPRIGWLGAASAIAYAYSFMFFTATVVYALVHETRDFEQLSTALDPAMTIHGVVMVIAGLGFGYAVARAGVLPRWTGVSLAIGVILISVSMGLADAVGLVGIGLRDLAFAGMGAALLRLSSQAGEVPDHL
jgi:hypothetical protein